MPSNSYTIKDDDNEYSDYIEIYNIFRGVKLCQVM